MALSITRTRYLLIITMLISHTILSQFNPGNDKAWITNAQVSATALDSQYLYIGGEFTFIGPNNGGQAKVTTSSSYPEVNLPFIYGGVSNSISDGNGGYFISGGFSEVGGHNISKLAHINPDGTVDINWAPNPNGTVSSIVLDGDYIYIGGTFTQIGGQSIAYFARLNVNSGLADPIWNPNPNGYVKTILIDGNSIYVGGYFTFIGGEFRNYVAKFNSSGILNPTWAPQFTILPNRYVNNLKKHGNYIYVAGNFSISNPIYNTNLVRVDEINGTADNIWKPSPNQIVNFIDFSENAIYVFGTFTYIGGQSRYKVAKLNLLDGRTDTNWRPSNTSNISTIAVAGDIVYIGRYKDSTIAHAPSRIVKLNAIDGGEIPTWGSYLDGIVNNITINSNILHIGGDFRMLGGHPSFYAAKINVNTWLSDTSWNPKPNGYITALTVDGDYIYIGGGFTQIGGQNRNRLAKLQKTTSACDPIWNPNCNGYTYIIRIRGNQVYVGGNFSNIGGSSRTLVSRLNNTTGAVDASWKPNPIGSDIRDILIRDEAIYVAGGFSSIGGISISNLSKLNHSNGAAYPNWGTNFSVGGPVYSIIEKDSNLYIGGNFINVGGFYRYGLARLKTSTGVLDTTWDCPINGNISSMRISRNSLYIAGGINDVAGSDFQGIAKINITSKLPDAKLKIHMSYPFRINSIQLMEQGDITDIFCGGLFYKLNDIPREYLAMFTVVNQSPNFPILAEPIDNSANLIQPITLKWLRNSEVERYLVEVGESDNFSNPIFVDSTVIDTAISLPSLENGKQYFWRVRGINSYGQSSFSSTWKFRTLGLLPMITQIQPFNQSINTPVSNVLFEWSVAEISQLTSKIRTTSNQKGNIEHSKENVLYWLEVTSDSNSGAFFFQDSTITASSIRLSGFNFLTNYHWRVKGKNSLGWNEFSSWSKFTTIIERPEQPNLVSPTNRDSGVVQPARLSWQSALRVEKYILQIGFDKFLTDMVFVDSLILDTSRVIPILPNLTWFYWRVIAKNIGGLSDTSDVWQFKTQGTPSVVTLLVPLNNAQFIPITDAVFKWTSAKDRTESIQNYRFELKIDTSQSNYIVLDTLLTDTVKIISGLSHKTTYFWRVGAKNEAGWGNFTTWNKFTTILKPISSPTGLVALPESVGQIKLNWSDNSDNELGFIVYRKVGDSTSASDLVVIDSVGMNSTEFIDSSVADTTLYSYLIRAYNNDTLSAQSNFATVVTLTDIMEISWGVPKEFVLFQNYPNPFNPSTLIRFGVPKDSYVEINLYSVQGEFIHRLLQDDKSAGYYEVKLELPTLSSGIYLYQIKAIEQDSRKTFTFSRKLILMK